MLSGIVERFTRIRRDDPDRALIHLPLARTTIVARELWDAAAEQRARLEALGIGANQLVIYAAGNRPQLLGLWLAGRSLGLALMPVDSGATPSELDTLVRTFGASAVLTADTAAPLPGRRVPFVRGLALVQPDDGISRHEYKDAAVLKVTSGSTGVPKATLTTEQQLLHDAEHITTAMDIRPDDCQMAAIPLTHAYGIGNLVLPLLLNGTAMVLRNAFVPQQFVADATAYGARIFPGAPFMFEHFSAHLPPGAWPPVLEILISAGARLEADTLRAFHSSFGVKIHSFYGATETGGITYDDSSDLRGEATVGRPMPGVTVTLLPDDGAPEGGGRVHVTSEAVASGYAGGERFDEVTGGRSYRTGDLGRFDARGHLTLTGRVSSFINVAGRKVQPDEVEQVLRSMPGISDARVLGIDDPARGQQIVACIVVSPGAEMSTLRLRQFCARRLAPHKIPRVVVTLDRIPLTERGKTDRRRLEATVAERLRGSSGTAVL
ncbi:MAG: class I adenylate-forming enzyme family protein [Vicinamibacterales bacterium]